ncbi:MAG TPA: hypothetical protein VFB19_15055 [Mycobacterium sp.]|nr:hypothetical protein [Mycobacterium sp.]
MSAIHVRRRLLVTAALVLTTPAIATAPQAWAEPPSQCTVSGATHSVSIACTPPPVAGVGAQGAPSEQDLTAQNSTGRQGSPH